MAHSFRSGRTDPALTSGSAGTHDLTYFSITYFNSTTSLQPARLDQTLLMSLYNHVKVDDLKIAVARFRIPTNNVPLSHHNIPIDTWAVGLSTDAHDPVVTTVLPIGWVPEVQPPPPDPVPTFSYILWRDSNGHFHLTAGAATPFSSLPYSDWDPGEATTSIDITPFATYYSPMIIERSWGPCIGVFDTNAATNVILIWNYIDGTAGQRFISPSSPNWVIDIEDFQVDGNPIWERLLGAAFDDNGDLHIMAQYSGGTEFSCAKFTNNTQTYEQYATNCVFPASLVGVGFGLFLTTTFYATDQPTSAVAAYTPGETTVYVLVDRLREFAVSQVSEKTCAIVGIRTNFDTPANYDMIYLIYDTTTRTFGGILPVTAGTNISPTIMGDYITATGPFEGAPGFVWNWRAATSDQIGAGSSEYEFRDDAITFSAGALPNFTNTLGFVNLPPYQPPAPAPIPGHGTFALQITSFQQYCNQINQAFAKIIAAGIEGWDTELVPQPYLQFDPLTRLFYLNLSNDYSYGYTETGVHYRVWFNEALQSLFSFPPSGTIMPTSATIPMSPLPNPPVFVCLETNVPNAAAAYKLYQERSSMGRLNDFARVLVQSTSFTINGNQEGANTGVQCITDTVPDVDNLTPGAALIYVPFFDRWYTIMQTSPIYRINLEINYQARDSNVYSIQVSPGDFWSVLLVFRRISAS